MASHTSPLLFPGTAPLRPMTANALCRDPCARSSQQRMPLPRRPTTCLGTRSPHRYRDRHRRQVESTRGPRLDLIPPSTPTRCLPLRQSSEPDDQARTPQTTRPRRSTSRVEDHEHGREPCFGQAKVAGRGPVGPALVAVAAPRVRVGPWPGSCRRRRRIRWRRPARRVRARPRRRCAPRPGDPIARVLFVTVTPGSLPIRFNAVGSSE